MVIGTQAVKRARGVGVVLAMTAAALAGGEVDASAQRPVEARAGAWVGTTYGRLQRSSRWVSAGTTLRGDFSFRLDSRGRLTGYATVSYEPNFDTDRLNGLIGYARDVGAAALAGIPIVGGLAGAQLSSIFGVAVEYDELITVREGGITGSIRRGRATLRWTRGEDRGIPFRVYLDTNTGRQDLTSGAIPVTNAWAGRGRVVGPSLTVGTERSTTTPAEGVTEQTSSYWSARRVD